MKAETKQQEKVQDKNYNKVSVKPSAKQNETKKRESLLVIKEIYIGSIECDVTSEKVTVH